MHAPGSDSSTSSRNHLNAVGRRGAGYVLAAVAGAVLVAMFATRGNEAPVAADATVADRAPREPLPPAPVADWANPPVPDFSIPPYAAELAGVRIIIDPGHGGRRDRQNWKVGPTGLREAEVNLRVAGYLAEFLKAVDADVRLTRTTDDYLHPDDNEDLRLRAELANTVQADLLLSIHHNAFHDPDVNYSLVFYHGEPEESPAAVNAAQQLAQGLHDALRLEQIVGVAVRSDLQIYPRSGFAVLRHARVPAVLAECSFYTDPGEEERLRDPLYNRRAAHGLFLGLARWAYAGLPRVRVHVPEDPRPGSELVVQLDDGLSRRYGPGRARPKIFADSIRVALEGGPADYAYDRATARVTLSPPRGLEAFEVFVDFRNLFGQAVLHPRLEVYRDESGEWRAR